MRHVALGEFAFCHIKFKRCTFLGDLTFFHNLKTGEALKLRDSSKQLKIAEKAEEKETEMATATATQSFEINFGSARCKPPPRFLVLSKRKTITKEVLLEKQKSAEERRKVRQ